MKGFSRWRNINRRAAQVFLWPFGDVMPSPSGVASPYLWETAPIAGLAEQQLPAFCRPVARFRGYAVRRRVRLAGDRRGLDGADRGASVAPFRFGQHESKRLVASAFATITPSTPARGRSSPRMAGAPIGRVEGFGGADLRFGQILCAKCATSISHRLAPRHKFLSRGGHVTDGPASRSMQRHDQSISGPGPRDRIGSTAFLL
jgi:hypothetical protein